MASERKPRDGAEPGDEFLDDLGDLPNEPLDADPFDPDDAMVLAADREEQIELMRRWFFARYCDPAVETPYESREGGYIWVWGGPYDPSEHLHDRFSNIVDEEAIDELVDELYMEVGPDWAPVRRGGEDYYDRFALEVEEPDDPLSKLGARLRQALSVLDLQGPDGTAEQLAKMAFGAVISALEAYLWETMAFWVKADRQVLRRIVCNMPDLKDQPLKLGQIFDQHDAINARVMAYLHNLVWHRWDKVSQLFRFGLGVKMPSFKPFDEALVKRHDIVHRSGHDREGNPVSVSAQDARDLAEAAQEFATRVYEMIMAKAAQGGADEI